MFRNEMRIFFDEIVLNNFKLILWI